MEREQQIPRPNTQPAAAPEATTQSERGGFFEKLRKKVKRSAEKTEQQPARRERETQPSAETPRRERRAFGKSVLNLFVREAPAEAAPAQPATPEVQPLLSTPEATPEYDRATRMRRFARVVIARVMGEAAQEPARASRRGERRRADTQPLVEAADDLREAADDLSDTIRSARHAPAETTAFSGGSYDAIEPQPERYPPETPADRMDDRLRRLEQSAEASKTATLAAIGLGVIAVLVTGTEYFGSRRRDREIRRDMKRQFKKQEKAITSQSEEFNRLRETEAADMNRIQRQQYYERLSTFTHQQAERTREATRDLQEVVAEATPVAAAPAPATLERPHNEQVERRTWHAPQQERHVTPEPLRRVETADTVERVPGQQTGNAGTGFFGGGGGGIARGTGPSDLTPPTPTIDPNSREARQLEALRKAEQARLQQNAWLYSAALVGALISLLVITIVLG